MENQQILNQLTDEREQAVFKGMKTDMETGKALLNPEKMGTFLREATLPNTILKDANFNLMKSYKKELNRTNINGRVLQNGYDAEGNTKTSLTAADVDFGVNELDAKKLKALCEITDEEKEDNLEQAQFEQTLLSMMGERIGEDLEYWALFGDTTITAATNDLLHSNDGWIKKCTNTITNGTAASSDFNVEANTVESMFDAMILKIPPRFRDRSKLKFYVPFEVEDAYRNLLKSRGTVLGDTNQTGFAPIRYKNIPLIPCQTLDATDARSIDNKVYTILTDPANMEYGIWKNITVEPDRIVKEEKTQYYFRIRADVQYNYTNATCIANMTETVAKTLPDASKA
jgi:HK97 family phage major capsid protein